MAENRDYDYKHLKAKYGKRKALEICMKIIKAKHPPKRERIEVR